jgi:hypothetical protein
MSERKLITCMRVDSGKTPTPDSMQLECIVCNCKVWASGVTRNMLLREEAEGVICLTCVNENSEKAN